MKRHKGAVLAFMLLGGCADASAGPELPPSAADSGPAAPELPELANLAPPPAQKIEARYIGSAYAKDRVEVATERSGTLASVAFDVGDRVEKGDVLFRLKAQNAKLSLTASRKQKSAAEAALRQAQREYARIKELFEAGAATPASLDAVQSQVDQAEIAVQQADVAVEMGQSGVGDTFTRSPIAGIVVERYKDPGEAVTSMPPTVVLVIEDNATLELRFRIPELDLRHVDVGTELQALFPALDETRSVKVSRIGSSVDVRTRTIEVIAEVDNADLRLKPGMSIEVKAASPQPKPGDDAPSVPTEGSKP